MLITSLEPVFMRFFGMCLIIKQTHERQFLQRFDADMPYRRSKGDRNSCSFGQVFQIYGSK